MAKDRNDDIDENDDISRDSSGDINEADDNFGLPDMDYEPVEDAGDKKEEETDTTEETYYTTTTTEEENWQEEEPVEEEPAYIPGSYTPPKQESNAPKIIALILVLVVAGLALWYFGFYRPEQQAVEKARIEKQQQQQAERERLAQEKAAEEERQRLEAQRAAGQEAAAAEDEVVQDGTIETVSSRAGRYYVVIASAIDDDLAMDYAKQRQKEGLNTFIIEPYGTTRFHRVATAYYDTWAEAQNQANDLKGQYGDEVWVIKY